MTSHRECGGELDTSVETGRVQQEPVLRAKDLRRFYGSWGRKYWLFGPRTRPPVRAVTDVDFHGGAGTDSGNRG